jgi:Protein of unknown function (DUF2934)
MPTATPMAPNGEATQTQFAPADSLSSSEAPKPSDLDNGRLAYALWQQLPASESISPNAIAQLAYALWQQRGCPAGSAEQDWLEAEQKLRASSVDPTPERLRS